MWLRQRSAYFKLEVGTPVGLSPMLANDQTGAQGRAAACVSVNVTSRYTFVNAGRKPTLK